jgi:hypothetical protein
MKKIIEIIKQVMPSVAWLMNIGDVATKLLSLIAQPGNCACMSAQQC